MPSPVWIGVELRAWGDKIDPWTSVEWEWFGADEAAADAWIEAGRLTAVEHELRGDHLICWRFAYPVNEGLLSPSRSLPLRIPRALGVADAPFGLLSALMPPPVGVCLFSMEVVTRLVWLERNALLGRKTAAIRGF